MVYPKIAWGHNPYIIGRPIYESDLFFGRQSLFDFIKSILSERAYVGRTTIKTNVILLHGQRRIGKTSVLRQIPRQLGLDEFFFVQFDLQDQTQLPLCRLLQNLAREISDYLDDLDLSISQVEPPTLEVLERDVYIFANNFLPQVYTALNGKRLVLLLDEFDVLSNYSGDASVDHFFPYLKSIIERQDKLFIIPVIGRRLDEMSTLMSLFKGAPHQEIGLLEQTSAEQLITKPAECLLKYSTDAIQTILKLSGRHPYFTQLLCQFLFEQARREQRPIICSEDVENVVEKAIEAGEGGLAWFRDGLPIPERVIFSAVAEAQENLLRSSKVGAINPELVMGEPRELLAQHGVIQTEPLLQAEKQLVDWEFLREVRATGQNISIYGYQVTIELVRRWLVKRYPLRQEIRELEKLNPTAEYLRNQAIEARQRSEHQKAVDLYEQVLEANPNHFQALFEIAEVCFELREYDRAEEYFKRAHLVDRPKNKEGLWEAQLKYAADLYQRGKTDSATQRIIEAVRLKYPEFLSLGSANKAPRSLQEIIKKRCESKFVGRRAQLDFFRENISLPLDDDRRRFLFYISGQDGVGKTWLLQQFRKIAQEVGAITAYIDESYNAVPEVMAQIAAEFEAQNCFMKTFGKYYHLYQQQRQESITVLETPELLSASVNLTLDKTALSLTHPTSIDGDLLDFNNDRGFIQEAREFSYVSPKWVNTKQTAFLEKPVEILTPFFLEDLCRVATETPLIALFFDSYETTGDYLDSWLRQLLDGNYGLVPATVVIATAGRNQLDCSLWIPYEELIAHIQLQPFTEEEAREYLGRQNLENERVVEEILTLSERLPWLVASFLAKANRSESQFTRGNPQQITGQHWLDDPKRREVLMNAALPRYINRDVLSVLVKDEQADKVFDWLTNIPFLTEQVFRWKYHPIVRDKMLQKQRQSSTQDWVNLHARLADYYDSKRLKYELTLSKEEKQLDETWQGYMVELAYHRLCQAPEKYCLPALNRFLSALKAQRSFARRWAEAVQQAGKDVGDIRVQRWGEQLINGLKAYDEKRYEVIVELFTRLLNFSRLEQRCKSVALSQRGVAYLRIKRYEEALTDFNHAAQLDPNDTQILSRRGEVYLRLQRYEDALADFNRSIELKSNDAELILKRSMVYLMMERHEEALAEFSRAIELLNNVGVITIRGTLYLVMKRYEEALADFNRAIALEPDNAELIANRGVIYGQMERYEEAIADFDRAINLKPDNTELIANRGVTYGQMKRYEEALADFNRAIALEPDNTELIANRGVTYGQMKHYEEALADFNRAIALEPDNAELIADRGVAYRQMKRYEEALADFNRAIALELDNTEIILGRGVTYRRMKRYEEALADFNRAITLEPDNAGFIANRGVIYGQMEHYQEALADFNRAIALEPDNAGFIANRGVTYRQMKCYEQALTEFNQAIALEPDNMEFIVGRGVTYRQMKCYEQALAEFNQAIALEPDNAGFIANRGVVYGQMEHYQETLADFNRAIALEPDNAGFIANRGMVYSQMKRYQEALADFNRAIALEPDNTEIIVGRGVIYRRMKGYEQALAEFNRAIVLKPDSTEFIVGRGLTYRQMKCYEEALADFNRAIVLEPDNAGFIANRGVTYGRMKRYEKALAEFNRALALEPDNAEFIANRGVTYHQMKRYEEALADFNRAIVLEPDNAEFIANRGVTYGQMKRYEKALAEFNRALVLEPDNTEIIAGRGVTYRQMKRYEEALVEFNRALALEPDNTEIIAGRGVTYRQMKRYEEALADCCHVVELQPNNAEAFIDRGDTYCRMKRYNEALADFNFAIKLEPRNTYAFSLRGETYAQMGRYNKALNNLNHAIKLEPNNSCLFWLRGTIHRRRDSYENALIDSDHAIKFEPRNIQAFYLRGQIYHQLGWYDEALAIFDQMIEQWIEKTDTIDALNDFYLEVEKDEVFNLRGLVLNCLARYREAVDSYEQGLKQNSHDYNLLYNYTLLYNLAVTLARWKGFHDAQKQINLARAAFLDKLNTYERDAALYGLGGLEAISGNTNQALDYLHQAILIDRQLIVWASRDIAWLDLHSDSRFRSLVPNATRNRQLKDISLKLKLRKQSLSIAQKKKARGFDSKSQ